MTLAAESLLAIDTVNSKRQRTETLDSDILSTPGQIPLRTASNLIRASSSNEAVTQRAALRLP
jgi:hypothetical protein